MQSSIDHSLLQLADHCGILTSYYDISGSLVEADPEVLLLVLKALGVELADPAQAKQRLDEIKKAEADRLLDPVYVLLPDSPSQIKLRAPQGAMQGKIEVQLEKESGERMEAHLPFQETQDLILPWNLEPGAHRLFLRWNKKSHQAHLLCSSGQAWRPWPRRAWGIFAPLYALHAKCSWGTGDYRLLKDLVHWAGPLGAQVVGTLPLLSVNFNSNKTPSPYFPWSRLFWNELYLDVEGIPEFSSCPEAQKNFYSEGFQSRLHKIQKDPLVPYAELHALKQNILVTLLKEFLRQGGPRQEAFQQYLQTKPLLQDYARSQSRRNSVLESPLAESYHQWVQWLCETQLDELAREAKDRGVRLALDYPLGVSGEGFDGQFFPHLFSKEISVGAPPDPFFSEGQNWGFPPLHPERIRETGYDYFFQTLRHQLRFGKLLRLDHIMGFHRMFWIPNGVEARKGIYVKYPAEEFYAVLALESQRQQAWVVGEDLGTVPPEVRPAMRRHQLLRTFIAQYENLSDISQMSQAIPEDSVAALNTHDMPPFAAFWGKRPSPRHALEQHLTALAKSPAALVMVNLEDLWLETEAQNVPGTVEEHPNWRKKFRLSWEKIQEEPVVMQTLKDLNHHRQTP